jgi:hypothetical protein
MAVNLKYFSPAEADALIPRITELLSAALSFKNQAERRAEMWQTARATLSAAEDAVFQGQVDFLVLQLNRRLEEIEALGCLPKDLNEGLVDFPSRVGGREVYLCWRLGEARVENWHGIAEGARGRQPLNRDQA